MPTKPEPRATPTARPVLDDRRWERENAPEVRGRHVATVATALGVWLAFLGCLAIWRWMTLQ